METSTQQQAINQPPALTVFYDGSCPLCVAEMRQLRTLDDARDGPARLQLEDILQVDFRQRYPHIDPMQADRILHGQLSDGRVLVGLDVTCLAWQLVGRKPWLQILRWPVLRWFADLAYRLFARNRFRLSWLLTGQRRCRSCRIDSSRSKSTVQRAS